MAAHGPPFIVVLGEDVHKLKGAPLERRAAFPTSIPTDA